MTIRLSTANRAAVALQNAARRADGNGDGVLTTQEIRAAQSAGVNGPAATKALLAYHAQHRSAVASDPEIRDADKSAAMKFMDVVEVDFATNAAKTQLARIDTYRGTRTRPANTADGVVTDAEIKNYGPSHGKLQREAGPLARYASTFR